MTNRRLPLLLLTLSLAAPLAANDRPGSPHADDELALRHEPIQPLPAPPQLDPAKVSLGERLFHEPRLSRGNDMACATCHDLNSNGADHHVFAPGRDGSTLDVNTLTVFNSSLNHRLFWDGRAASLEEQIDFVVANPKEFDTTWAEIITKLSQDADYRARFQAVYADGITAPNIRDAIATFERTLITTGSRFDRYLLGEHDAITAQEKEGYRLFKDYGCTGCHQGRNVGGNLFMKFGVFIDYFSSRDSISRADLGRYNVTGEPEDRHVFRVPSLRLAALTPPYFHDGSAQTLEDAVKIMARHQLGRIIPQRDVERIVAFLKTLPGRYPPAERKP